MTTAADARERHEPRPWSPLGAALVAAALFSLRLVFLSLPIGPQLGMLVGGLGLVSSIVSPFPLVVQRLRGAGPALATAGAASVLIGSVFGLGAAVSFLVILVAPAWLMGEALVRGYGLRRGCLWAFLLVSAFVLVLVMFSGPDLARNVTRDMEVSYSPEFLEQMRARLPAEQVEEWADSSRALVSALAVVYPAAFIILGGLGVVANAIAVRTYLAWRDPAWLEGGEFEGVRWPFGLAVVFVLSGLTVLAPPLRPAGYNVLLVIGFLLALQGLAVVLYYAHRLAGPPFLRIAVVVLVLVNPWAPQILALLGLLDLWFDFRRFADVPESPK